MNKFILGSSVVLTGLGFFSERCKPFAQRYYERNIPIAQELAVLSFFGPLALAAIPMAVGIKISKSIDNFNYNRSPYYRSLADNYKCQKDIEIAIERSKPPPKGGGRGNPQFGDFF